MPPLDPMTLPEGLPVPEDDGAARHLVGKALPEVALPATTGGEITLAHFTGTSVVFAYPLTGRPGGEMPGGEEAWNAIPGARGCTPELCSVRDGIEALGAQVFGVSVQDTPYQQEVAERLALTYPLLSDAQLAFANTLQLPCFKVEGVTLLKRLTLIARDGAIVAVDYPVFPPNEAATRAAALISKL